MFANIPFELQTFKQWVLWRFVTLDNGKITKEPYQCNGQLASVTNPETWIDFDTAVAAQKNGKFDGIGFVLTEQDPYCFIDLDHTDNDELIKQQHFIFENFIITYVGIIGKHS